MWKKVEYEKKDINKAGEKIIDPDITPDECAKCLKVIDNWRAAHAFPTNTFAIHLKHCVQDIPSAVVVQRLGNFTQGGVGTALLVRAAICQ